MLKQFVVKNYKNFKNEIVINLEDTAGYQYNTDCLCNDMVGKGLIYGKNATGKTNLGSALVDIYETLRGYRFPYEDGAFLNADSADSCAKFYYHFLFGDDDVIYEYEKETRRELVSERLIINDIDIFSCDFLEHNLVFDGLKYIKADTINYERYESSLISEDDTDGPLEKRIPFLRWLINNAAIEKDSVIMKLSNYVLKMIMVSNSVYRNRVIYNSFAETLESSKGLKDFEMFLNSMGIECALELKRLPDDQCVLYFTHDRLVPFFETASSGTLMATQLYRRLNFGKKPSFIYMDEFDAFYHYEMSNNIIKYLKSTYPQTQILLTSHNTNLISNKLVRPDCVFILSSEGKLTPLHKATQRELREGHNLEKMFISGEFSNYE